MDSWCVSVSMEHCWPMTNVWTISASFKSWSRWPWSTIINDFHILLQHNQQCKVLLSLQSWNSSQESLTPILDVCYNAVITGLVPGLSSAGNCRKFGPTVWKLSSSLLLFRATETQWAVVTSRGKDKQSFPRRLEQHSRWLAREEKGFHLSDATATWWIYQESTSTTPTTAK